MKRNNVDRFNSVHSDTTEEANGKNKGKFDDYIKDASVKIMTSTKTPQNAATSTTTANNYSYNPLFNTNFDLNGVTSLTRAPTSYLEDEEVMRMIGTSHSRRGQYIRQTWKQSRSRYLVSFATLILLIVVVYKASSSPSEWTPFDSYDDYSEGKNSKNAFAGTDGTTHGGKTSGFDYSGILMNDYSHLNSNVLNSVHIQKSLLSKIPKACLRERQNIKCQPQCPTLNPFVGEEKGSNSWKRASKLNKELIDDYISINRDSHDNNGKSHMLDIVFYGDSITEQWNGRWMGNAMKSKESIKTIFHTYFDPLANMQDSHKSFEDNGTEANDDIEEIDRLKGLSLGIAGDRTSNLLYRIQAGGELPNELDSKVFWLLIGTNDLSTNCSEDVVTLGILSIVQEIRSKKPGSIVVINGLLPRTDNSNGSLLSEESLNSNEEYKPTNTPVASSTTNSSLIEETVGDNHRFTRRSTKNIDSKPFDFWPSINAINHQLRQYASNHDKVEYFDPADLFIAQMGNEYFKQNNIFLMKELQDDYLHPTSLGHKIWAKVCGDPCIHIRILYKL